MLDLAGKVALVTGIGSVGPGWGNGRATATLLARQGAAIFGLDVDEAAARETERIVADEGGSCAVRRCDLTRAGEGAAAGGACVEAHGRVDILVNNVGGSEPGGPVELTEEAWDGQIELNL